MMKGQLCIKLKSQGGGQTEIGDSGNTWFEKGLLTIQHGRSLQLSFAPQVHEKGAISLAARVRTA
jgi:hypothetical protein